MFSVITILSVLTAGVMILRAHVLRDYDQALQQELEELKRKQKDGDGCS